MGGGGCRPSNMGGRTMGRPPLGPEIVDRIEGSEEAKKRARIILEVIAGRLSVEAACTALDIEATRFEDVRKEAFAGLVAALEPRPAGRPPKPVDEAAEKLKALEDENKRLKMELVTSHVREEIAVVLPHRARSKKNGRR